MSALMTLFLQPLRLVKQSLSTVSSTGIASSLVKPECFSVTAIRTKVRCYFPRPNEVKRVRRHGWQTRISTPNGRRVIMRRLLKGRYVLTH
ncbi:39S ribosomal protein L34, mitochondrial [Galleria mellonella]|uniref:Large ribosomal subunit protein bL34m n=1 Tax=Galleria mellonella TaxID=7137 RepID=A0A6J1WGD8_GALME|nr:39S ribosomal protein L34, mitochondrial [Galleria mellonella]